MAWGVRPCLARQGLRRSLGRRGTHAQRVALLPLTAPAASLLSARSAGAAGLRHASGYAGAPAERRRLWRWGTHEHEVPEASRRPLHVEEFQDPTAIACGAEHSAFVVGGRLHTYGSNGYQQLGREFPTGRPAPVAVEAEDGHRPAVLQVALGAYHSAVVSEGGALWTWGWGGSFWGGAGALGHGTSDSCSEPELVRRFVEEGVEVAQVACGTQHTLALSSSGRLYSTGRGKFGRLGRGEMQDETEFEEVEYFSQSNDSILNPTDFTTVAKVDAGDNFSAAMSSHGELWVWGRNDYGQIGLGADSMTNKYSGSRYPRLIRSLPLEGHQVVDFECGLHHVVALTQAGAIYEWGNRQVWEATPVSLPKRYAAGIKDVVRVVAGDGVSFALTAHGELYAWGPKDTGCLAEGLLGAAEPQLVAAETFDGQPVVDIASSHGRFLAITLES